MTYHVSMDTFPIMLNLTGRSAVVVGAGAIGLRKVRSLLAAGARVRLVSPDAPEDLPADVERLAEPYRPDHLHNARLVFACTSDRDLNARIADDARSRGTLVNAVDQPDDCDFFMPAIHRAGPVVLAVGTGGTSPALAGTLRDRLAESLPAATADFAELLGRLREELHATLPDVSTRMKLLRTLADPAVFEHFTRSGEPAVRARLAELLDDLPGGRP